MNGRTQIAHRAVHVAVLAAIAIAAFFVYRSLGRYSWAEIAEAVQAIPLARLGSALVFVAASYLCLSGFDTLAVRYAGKPLPWRQAGLASFCALSIGHNVGMAALSSGAVRYRFYSRFGLSGGEIAKVIGFCGITVGLGLAALAAIVLLLDLGPDTDLFGIDAGTRIAAGLGCLAVPTGYLLICALRLPVRLRQWRIEPPGIGLAALQVGIGTLNFACVAAAIHQLVAVFGPISYFEVAGAYVTANIASLISHVPGGLGVLEATMLGILPGKEIIGALVAFRVLYFFVPLAIGLPTFLLSEAYYRHRPSCRLERRAAERS
ncbi:lysylphosphatidylglycerol synthase domain-containing protein [Neorhizobium sp. NCHU2750]|uniref:lysylphosphatidylglycerol synthase domain-containing protein n=1 Tax=Neorhizobium sp. NCHU2750 TaxID=1825976 RepID=UPI000E7622E7|nr:membrane protein [Neorhizobium sp. NCHU2750]